MHFPSGKPQLVSPTNPILFYPILSGHFYFWPNTKLVGVENEVKMTSARVSTGRVLPTCDRTIPCCTLQIADDTILCYQSHDLTRLNKAINSDLQKHDTWLQGNKLSLNVAKTHSMLISTKQKQNILKCQNRDLDLKIRENGVEVVKKTKYLGIQNIIFIDIGINQSSYKCLS